MPLNAQRLPAQYAEFATPHNAKQAPTQYVKSVKISKAKVTVTAGKTKTIKVTVKAKGKVSKNLSVKVANKKVAKATLKGTKLKVCGKRAGKTKITLTTKAKNKKGKKIKKTIKIKVTSPMTVCIDAGHGYKVDLSTERNNPYNNVTDPIEPGGTSGVKSGPEYKVNLAVALLLQEDLEQKGIKVVMVRTKNKVVIGSRKRAMIANSCDADLFIRLHCDSAGTSTRGFLTLVPNATGYQAKDGLYKKSRSAGRFMHKRIYKKLNANNRGIQKRSDMAGFNWCTQPVVLFEMANMDNTQDDGLLASTSYKKKLAQAISDATLAWLVK